MATKKRNTASRTTADDEISHLYVLLESIDKQAERLLADGKADWPNDAIIAMQCIAREGMRVALGETRHG